MYRCDDGGGGGGSASGGGGGGVYMADWRSLLPVGRPGALAPVCPGQLTCHHSNIVS